MLSVTKLPDNWWLMLDNNKDDLYGACVYKLGDRSEFVLFSVDNAPEGSHYFQIRSEIYRTSFWDFGSRDDLAEMIVRYFSECQVFSVPVELIYAFGGDLPNSGFAVRYVPLVTYMGLH